MHNSGLIVSRLLLSMLTKSNLVPKKIQIDSDVRLRPLLKFLTSECDDVIFKNLINCKTDVYEIRQW